MIGVGGEDGMLRGSVYASDVVRNINFVGLSWVYESSAALHST